jgi:hypothetical protein
MALEATLEFWDQLCFQCLSHRCFPLISPCYQFSPSSLRPPLASLHFTCPFQPSELLFFIPLFVSLLPSSSSVRKQPFLGWCFLTPQPQKLVLEPRSRCSRYGDQPLASTSKRFVVFVLVFWSRLCFINSVHVKHLQAFNSYASAGPGWNKRHAPSRLSHLYLVCHGSYPRGDVTRLELVGE